MSGQIQPVEVFDLVIFGGTGDLALRKLLPALFHRFADGQITGRQPHHRHRPRYAGRSRIPHSRACGAATCVHRAHEAADARTFPASRRQLSPAGRDARTSGWDEFARLLIGREERVRVFYLATVQPILRRHLRAPASTAASPRAKCASCMEKPIGRDLTAPQPINDAVGTVVRRERRPSASIITSARRRCRTSWRCASAMRCSSRCGTPTTSTTCRSPWPKPSASSDRGAYYDDMPARCATWCRTTCCNCCAWWRWSRRRRSSADAVRDEKLKVLRSLRPIDAGNADQLTVRGQYRAGARPTGRVPGYLGGIGNAATRTPRPSSRSRRKSPTGAGPACRSICAPASAWPSACRRSSSRSAPFRIRSSTPVPDPSRRTGW